MSSGQNQVDTEKVLGGGALDRPPTKVPLQAETPVRASEQRVRRSSRPPRAASSPLSNPIYIGRVTGRTGCGSSQPHAELISFSERLSH